MAEAPLLEARELRKMFALRAGLLAPAAGRVVAVDGVSLALHDGEAVGLVGESGCGKSTLARLLVGLLTPSSGQVLLGGEPLRALRRDALLAARRRVQLIFQDPIMSLNPRMSVGEALAEPLRIHRLASGAAARRRRVEELLAGVQLPASYAARLPRELSGGERQRVGIARALAVKPRLLICDEPIASLDVSVGAQILELLRSLRQQRQLALLFISHDLRAVASLCDQIIVMQAGRFVERGPTAALLARPQQPYTELLLRSADLDLDALSS